MRERRQGQTDQEIQRPRETQTERETERDPEAERQRLGETQRESEGKNGRRLRDRHWESRGDPEMETDAETGRDREQEPGTESGRDGRSEAEGDHGGQQRMLSQALSELPGRRQPPPTCPPPPPPTTTTTTTTTATTYLHEVLPLAGDPQGRREAAAGLLVPVLCGGQGGAWVSWGSRRT